MNTLFPTPPTLPERFAELPIDHHRFPVSAFVLQVDCEYSFCKIAKSRPPRDETT